MYRALAAVAIVAIIAVVVLVIFLVHRWQGRQADKLRALRAENQRMHDVLDAIQREAAAQLAAGNASHDYTLTLIAEHDRKELTT